MILPCPVFKWERECENCGATIEVYYPPDIAFENGLGNVKEVCVREEESLVYAPQAMIDEDGRCTVLANICTFCRTPVKYLDLLFELVDMLSRGIGVHMTWIACELEDYCICCGIELDESQIAKIENKAWEYKRRIDEAIERGDSDVAYLIQNMYQIIDGAMCDICFEEKPYYCAYCERTHKFDSKYHQSHTVYRIDDKKAVKKAKRLLYKLRTSKEPIMFFEVDEDTAVALTALLSKKRIAELIEVDGSELHLRILDKEVYLAVNPFKKGFKKVIKELEDPAI